ncbi:hypothetical protein BJ085DRAFT_35940 [Dimargaris cristalligena]|uniref:F-box domain-containing protein n=1 Tax=Dimargaris cristalligena TaxID=215637 RepID=A0A4P9ZLQ7_9FUNG|nr:hypothetical protein BJ085DRAFT_35940 [Dimargaris cristalligena]|eukprot:RKP34217.1 hypothetical protein BJ085DRAFT_35940 [Dimargaris cristalligena]
MLLAHCAMVSGRPNAPGHANYASQASNEWSSKSPSQPNEMMAAALMGDNTRFQQNTAFGEQETTTDDHTQPKERTGRKAVDFPPEVLGTMANYLPAHGLSQLAQTSKYNQALVNSKPEYVKMIDLGLGPQNIDWEVTLKKLMSAELTSAVFHWVYRTLNNNQISPTGEPLIMGNDMEIDSDPDIAGDLAAFAANPDVAFEWSDLWTGKVELLSHPELRVELQMAYPDWCYVRLDQLDQGQLATLFPLAKIAIESDIEKLWTITETILKLREQSLNLPAMVRYGNATSIVHNPNSWHSASGVDVADTTAIYSISLIIGALVHYKKDTLLQDYIARLMDVFNMSGLLDPLIMLAKPVLLEFGYVNFPDISTDLRWTLGITGPLWMTEIYNIALLLGFNKAATVMKDGAKTKGYDLSLDTYSSAFRSLNRQIFINRVEGQDGKLETSVSFLTLRSTLPPLPKSAFVEQALSNKLVDQWLSGTGFESAALQLPFTNTTLRATA